MIEMCFCVVVVCLFVSSIYIRVDNFLNNWIYFMKFGRMWFGGRGVYKKLDRK